MTLTRVEILQQVVTAMWLELRRPPEERDLASLEEGIRNAGYGWTLPTQNNIHDDELLTTAEIADHLGLAASTVRNWSSRHGLRQYDGRYRWRDIERLVHSLGARTKSTQPDSGPPCQSSEYYSEPPPLNAGCNTPVMPDRRMQHRGEPHDAHSAPTVASEDQLEALRAALSRS